MFCLPCLSAFAMFSPYTLDMYIELTGVSKDFPGVYSPQIVKLAIFSQTKVTILFFRVGHEILKDDSREGRGGS